MVKSRVKEKEQRRWKGGGWWKEREKVLKRGDERGIRGKREDEGGENRNRRE